MLLSRKRVNKETKRCDEMLAFALCCHLLLAYTIVLHRVHKLYCDL